ncbi:MAG: multi-sensor hybrid histidine kinase [Acidobacteriales bacterium]|nr:multi-sensor hybrid histidine kinase [Terriglobales bacterium]
MTSEQQTKQTAEMRPEKAQNPRAIAIPLFLAALIISVPSIFLYAIHSVHFSMVLRNDLMEGLVGACSTILSCLTCAWLYSETQKNPHPGIMSLSIGFAFSAICIMVGSLVKTEEMQFRWALVNSLWVTTFAAVTVGIIAWTRLRRAWRTILQRSKAGFWAIGCIAFCGVSAAVLARSESFAADPDLRFWVIRSTIAFLLLGSGFVVRLYLQKRTSIVLCFGLGLYLFGLRTISQMWSMPFQLEWWCGNLLEFGSLFLVAYSIVEARRLQDRLKLVETLAFRTHELERSNADLQSSEDQLRQAQKMEAIGRLAGGIAHDFNNILTIIHGFSDLILHELAEDDPRRKHAERISNAARQASSLTYQLLAFSRKQLLTPVTLSVNMIIVELGRMLPRLLGEDIELTIINRPETGCVRADRGQLEQLIMNLAVNARDAMPKGGQLTIETSNVVLDDSYGKQHLAVLPGTYVMISVSDTGLGIDAATQLRIFEPFFTTKKEGEGTGLGLSTVYGIVKQSGGTIWVYSELGKGTTFKVYLPRAGDSPRPEVPEPTKNLSGKETVLLVEDSEDVRNLARISLTGQGYVVLEAKNAFEAMQVYQSAREPIDLLLTDMVMPGISGRELVDELHNSRPELRVVMMSGYSEKAFADSMPLPEMTSFLQKPFTRDSLLAKVREALA